MHPLLLLLILYSQRLAATPPQLNQVQDNITISSTIITTVATQTHFVGHVLAQAGSTAIRDIEFDAIIENGNHIKSLTATTLTEIPLSYVSTVTVTASNSHPAQDFYGQLGMTSNNTVANTVTSLGNTATSKPRTRITHTTIQPMGLQVSDIEIEVIELPDKEDAGRKKERKKSKKKGKSKINEIDLPDEEDVDQKKDRKKGKSKINEIDLAGEANLEQTNDRKKGKSKINEIDLPDEEDVEQTNDRKKGKSKKRKSEKLKKRKRKDKVASKTEKGCLDSTTQVLPVEDDIIPTSLPPMGGCCKQYAGTKTKVYTQVTVIPIPQTEYRMYTETVVIPKTVILTDVRYEPYPVTRTSIDTMYMMKPTAQGCGCELGANGLMLPAGQLPPGIFATPVNEVDRSKYDIIGYAGRNMYNNPNNQINPNNPRP